MIVACICLSIFQTCSNHPPQSFKWKLIVISDFQGLTFSLHLPWLPCCAALADPLNFLKHSDLANGWLEKWCPNLQTQSKDNSGTIQRKPLQSSFFGTPSRVVAECCTALCASLCEHKDGRKHGWFEDAIKAKCRETCRLRHVHANHWLVYPKPNKAQQFDAGLSEGATKPKCLEKYWSERKREIRKSKLNTQCKPWQCACTPWHVHAKHGLHHLAHCHHLLHACMSPRALG